MFPGLALAGREGKEGGEAAGTPTGRAAPVSAAGLRSTPSRLPRPHCRLGAGCNAVKNAGTFVMVTSRPHPPRRLADLGNEPAGAPPHE